MNLFIAKNDVDFFKKLIFVNTRLWNLKFSQNSRLMTEALNIYKTLILLKSIPIVQEVYKAILFDCELAYSMISTVETKKDGMVKTDALKFKMVSLNEMEIGDDLLGDIVDKLETKELETCFVFNLCIIAELGNVKNSLISV
jgi:hypothetical protein